MEKEIIGYKDILENEKDEELRDMVKKELPEYENLFEEKNKELMLALLPKDEADKKNAILEIRAGTGGDEAAYLLEIYIECIQSIVKVEVGKFLR